MNLGSLIDKYHRLKENLMLHEFQEAKIAA